jgi:hypothetical protein
MGGTARPRPLPARCDGRNRAVPPTPCGVVGMWGDPGRDHGVHSNAEVIVDQSAARAFASATVCEPVRDRSRPRSRSRATAGPVGQAGERVAALRRLAFGHEAKDRSPARTVRDDDQGVAQPRSRTRRGGRSVVSAGGKPVRSTSNWPRQCLPRPEEPHSPCGGGWLTAGGAVPIMGARTRAQRRTRP